MQGGLLRWAQPAPGRSKISLVPESVLCLAAPWWKRNAEQQPVLIEAQSSKTPRQPQQMPSSQPFCGRQRVSVGLDPRHRSAKLPGRIRPASAWFNVPCKLSKDSQHPASARTRSSALIRYWCARADRSNAPYSWQCVQYTEGRNNGRKIHPTTLLVVRWNMQGPM